MVDVSKTIVLVGSTIKIRNEVKDFDGQPLEPDTQEVKIYNAEKELVSIINTGFSVVEPGEYYIYYVVENESYGEWKAVWKVVKDNRPDIDYVTFPVKEVV